MRSRQAADRLPAADRGCRGPGAGRCYPASPPRHPGTVGPTTADPRLCAVQQDKPTQRAGTTARPEDLVIDRVANPLGRLSQMAICPVDASPPYHRLVFFPPSTGHLKSDRLDRRCRRHPFTHRRYNIAPQRAEIPNQARGTTFQSLPPSLTLGNNSCGTLRLSPPGQSCEGEIETFSPPFWLFFPLPPRLLFTTAISPRPRSGRPFIIQYSYHPPTSARGRLGQSLLLLVQRSTTGALG